MAATQSLVRVLCQALRKGCGLLRGFRGGAAGRWERVGPRCARQPHTSACRRQAEHAARSSGLVPPLRPKPQAGRSSPNPLGLVASFLTASHHLASVHLDVSSPRAVERACSMQGAATFGGRSPPAVEAHRHMCVLAARERRPAAGRGAASLVHPSQWRACRCPAEPCRRVCASEASLMACSSAPSAAPSARRARRAARCESAGPSLCFRSWAVGHSAVVWGSGPHCCIAWAHCPPARHVQACFPPAALATAGRRGCASGGLPHSPCSAAAAAAPARPAAMSPECRSRGKPRNSVACMKWPRSLPPHVSGHPKHPGLILHSPATVPQLPSPSSLSPLASHPSIHRRNDADHLREFRGELQA